MSIRKITNENITKRLLTLVDELTGGNAAEFAQKAGIKPVTFHNYLKGRLPNIECLNNICHAFNVNLNWLVAGKEDKYLICESKRGKEIQTHKQQPIFKDKTLAALSNWLDELCETEPFRRDWFRGEMVDHFPAFKKFLDERKTINTGRKEPGDTTDKDFNIREQIADIKDALMIMGIKTGIFKEKKETEVNANTPIEQQVSGIRDTLNAMCIKMGLLEDRRKEQVPIGFPCRRHSNDE